MLILGRQMKMPPPPLFMTANDRAGKIMSIGINLSHVAAGLNPADPQNTHQTPCEDATTHPQHHISRANQRLSNDKMQVHL